MARRRRLVGAAAPSDHRDMTSRQSATSTRPSAPASSEPAIPATRANPATGLSQATGASRVKSLLPGLAITCLAVAVAWSVNRLEPTFSPLTCAVLLGAAAANLRLLPRGATAGLAFSGRRLMRLGIVLLGLRLAAGDVLALGWKTLIVTVGVVLLTFFGTQRLGRRLGLPGDQPLLVATGFSICGASAVAAMNSVTDSEEDDVITSVALVTLCGTLAIFLLPLLHHPLGLGDVQFGRWVGASVHDVGQVVAAAQTAGPTALGQAVVVKMMRIAMLAPLVASVALARRGRSSRAQEQQRQEQDRPQPQPTGTQSPESTPAPAPPPTTHRPPLVPLFVLGFLAMIGLRSTGLLSTAQVNLSQDLANLLMAAGLFALGTGVDVPKLARTGGRALALGLLSWLLIASAAFAGVRLTT